MNIGVNSTDMKENSGRSTTYTLYYTTCYVGIAVQYYLWIWKYYTESTQVYSLWSLTEGLTQCLFQHWLRCANEPISTVDSNILIIPAFTVQATISSATTISLGGSLTCKVLDNASVKCWGYNAFGQLGIESTTQTGDSSGEMASLSAVNLGTGRTATAIATGYYHSCAKLNNGDLKCWGRNSLGQLGIDSTTNIGDSSGEMASLDAIDLQKIFL